MAYFTEKLGLKGGTGTTHLLPIVLQESWDHRLVTLGPGLKILLEEL